MGSFRRLGRLTWRASLVVPLISFACGRAYDDAPDVDRPSGVEAGTAIQPLSCEVKLVDPLAAKPLSGWTPCAMGEDCWTSTGRAPVITIGNTGVVLRREQGAMERFSFEDVEGRVRIAAELAPSCYPYVFVGPLGVAIDHRAHYFQDGVHPVPPRIVSFVRWSEPTKVERHSIAEASGATGPWSMQTSAQSSLHAACAQEHVMIIGTRTVFDVRCDMTTLERFAKPLDERSFAAGPELGPFATSLGVRANDDLVVFQDGGVRILGGSSPVTLLETTTQRQVTLDRSDDALVWADLDASSSCDSGMSSRVLGQSVLLESGSVESKVLSTYEVPCSADAGEIYAHDGYVAVGVPPMLVRRSDGVRLDAKFEYPSRRGIAFETVVYLDAKWLVTDGRDGLVRRTLTKLPLLP